jgi:hypothetical protein
VLLSYILDNSPSLNDTTPELHSTLLSALCACAAKLKEVENVIVTIYKSKKLPTAIRYNLMATQTPKILKKPVRDLSKWIEMLTQCVLLTQLTNNNILVGDMLKRTKKIPA